MTRLLALGLAVSLGLLAGCSDDLGDAGSVGDGPSDPGFSYAGDTGPDSWGSLRDEWAACGEGVEQSPIDLTGAVPDAVTAITLDYSEGDAVLEGKPYTVDVEPEDDERITVGDSTYDLAQMHFHSPSEHTIDGAAADVELHFVHADADGNLLVIGVLGNEGAANSALADIVDGLSDVEAGEEPEAEFDPTSLMGGIEATYRYEGSLTTPPCTEGVQWVVKSEPIELSTDQLAVLQELHEGTNRPVQPLGERQIVASAP